MNWNIRWAWHCKSSHYTCSYFSIKDIKCMLTTENHHDPMFTYELKVIVNDLHVYLQQFYCFSSINQHVRLAEDRKRAVEDVVKKTKETLEVRRPWLLIGMLKVGCILSEVLIYSWHVKYFACNSYQRRGARFLFASYLLIENTCHKCTYLLSVFMYFMNDLLW